MTDLRSTLDAIEESKRSGALKALADAGYSTADLRAPVFAEASDPAADPVVVRVVAESPAERLRRLALVDPDVPREDLWEAIATAVTDVNERLAVLEAEAADRATWTARGRPVQPG